MGLGRDWSLPSGVWGKAPRFSQKARGGLNGYTYVLSKYGHVLPIGVNGFGEKIRSLPIETAQTEEFWLDSFERYQLTDPEESISDDQILNFILYGNLENDHINNAISAIQKKPFLIVRKCLEEIQHLLSTNKYLAIFSDFGNGKSVLLKQILAYLSMSGKQVFFLQNPDGDYINDIVKINNIQGDSIVVIDDYSVNIDILLYVIKYNSDNVRVVFADRSNSHDRSRKRILDEGIKFAEIAVDVLNEDESEQLVAIIDNLGFWGEKAVLPKQRKIDLIIREDKGQISHALLNIFNSPQIKNRINLLISPIVNNSKFKDTVFSICLLEIINLPRSSSLVSEVSGNDEIYKSDLRNNLQFKQLFHLKGNVIVSKSSIFSTALLKNHFSSSYLTDKLLDLAEKYNKLQHNGVIEKELFKSLLRFSFIERLLPEKGKLNILIKYYEELKVRVTWLKFNPHFWLQYGMARMNFGQLPKAQSNLDEAYVLARGKEKYDTSYIDTQQARLHILKSLAESDGNSFCICGFSR